MDLINKLQSLIETIQFVEGVPYISIKLPKEWIVLKNPNFTVTEVQLKKVIHPNSPNIPLNGCLEYLNQIYEFNQELVLKKEWLKTKTNELKELATSLPINELNKVIITTIDSDEYFIDPIKYVDDVEPEPIHNIVEDHTFKMEREPDFDEEMIQTEELETNQKKFYFNPETGEMEEM